MNTQFRKGVIEMCILALIDKKDMYGYEIVQAISRHTDINEGTVYPILRRLTMENYFSTYLAESTEGPARKYYRITESGKAYLENAIKEWRQTTDFVEQILKGDNENEQI